MQALTDSRRRAAPMTFHDEWDALAMWLLDRLRDDPVMGDRLVAALDEEARVKP